jgi:hypothetical protein
MKSILRFVGKLAFAAVVLIAVGALVIYTDSYDVSAKSGHTKLDEKALGSLLVRSAPAHARDIVSPAKMDFRDPAVLEKTG